MPEFIPATELPDLYVEINGVRWATRNLDTSNLTGDFAGFAIHPAYPGLVYQFDRISGWILEERPSVGAGINHRWGPVGINDDYTAARAWRAEAWNNINVISPGWYADRDPCRIVGDGNWRLPTIEELRSLALAGHQEYYMMRACGRCQPGRLVGTAPNQIFVPFVGARGPLGPVEFVNFRGTLWSAWVPIDAVPSVAIFAPTGFLGNAPTGVLIAGVPASNNPPFYNAATVGQDRRRGNSIRCVRVD